MENSPTEEQICPITLDRIHEPVISIHGHIYEHEALMTWVNEHETSPLTRQPLHLNEIFSDENHLMNRNSFEEIPPAIGEQRAPIEEQIPAVNPPPSRRRRYYSCIR